MLSDSIIANASFRELASTASRCQGGDQIHIIGISGSLDVAVIATLQQQTARPFLFVTPDRESSERVRDDALLLLNPAAIGHYVRPLAGGGSTSTFLSPSDLSVLHALLSGDSDFVVTHATALVESLPDPEAMLSGAFHISVGKDVLFQDLARQLESNGFDKKDFVEAPGDLSVRGGILDVFPFNGESPLRIEFFGDSVDSIREFDPLSQRSIRQIETIKIVPSLSSGTSNLSSTPPTLSSLVDYLRPDTIIVWSDPQFVNRSIENQFMKESVTVIPRAILDERLTKFTQITIGPKNDLLPTSINFRSIPQPSFNGSIVILRDYLRDLQRQEFSITISCDSQSELKRFKELLLGDHDENNGLVSAEAIGSGIRIDGITFALHSLHEGFVLPESRLAVFTEHQIFNRIKRRGRQRKPRVPSITRKELQKLGKGDFVVHADYGVGKFDGLKKIRVRNIDQEVVKLIYDQGDTLYVNLNYVNRIQKYSSKEGHIPKLSRLGSAEWDRLKLRAKKRIKDIARELIQLYARRKQSSGFAFGPDTAWQKELEASFMFEDTFDQAKTTIEVKQDMEAPNPMDRLVCGDVGFGKTEIAVRAAFKAIMSGKQVAVLVPTTILAVQHLNTFIDRTSRYSVQVAALSRFKSRKEQAAIIEQLRFGSIDIVIGTHRLLSKDVQFKDLGLLVIDEEHRFGVAAKEKLRQLKTTVDTLTLTATPIPRTLQFSLMGSRDLSIIATPPRNRLPIITEIREYNDDVISEAIKREIKRRGQVYFVHDRVQRIGEVTERLRMLLPGFKIQYAHGQMHAHELENVMLEFMDKKVDVLVCTKIIESGLDMPNVNTIIVNRADRFGMAELYQLRGRVGRSNVQAYAYLLSPPFSVLPRKTIQRLQAVEEFVELGSGFNLAMRDLEIRGAGNLLGGEQSGFIETMGFETYTRVLDEAVRELKDQEFADLFAGQTSVDVSNEAIIELDVEALIPDQYIQNDAERLEIYRRLYALQTSEQLEEIRGELKDRFGALPKEVDNLIRAVRLKLHASRLGLKKILLSDTELQIEFPPAEQKKFYESDQFHRIMAQVSHMKDKGVGLKQDDDTLRLVVRFPAGVPLENPLATAETYFNEIFGGSEGSQTSATG